MSKMSLLALSFLIFTVTTVYTDETHSLTPERCSEKPLVDGILDENIWKHAPTQFPFLSYNQTWGDTLPFRTDVWLSYDDDHLYFAFSCYDDAPELIKTSISQRDQIFADDWIGISLDAMGHQQSSLDIFINPNGIQADILNSVVSGENTSPDFVWKSAGHVNDQGYQVEVAIPLRTLRFQAGENVTMGILFFRKISRMGMKGAWPELSPGKGIHQSHARVTYKNLKAPRVLEFLPSFTSAHVNERETPAQWGEMDSKSNIGISTKFGINSSITAEFTYNPDFSQVESDAFQVSVNQRFPNFYKEKRPFFMEGLEILNFGIIPHGDMQTPVHTRNIVDPKWGAKLSGFLGKTAFGVLAVQDDSPAEIEDDESLEGKKANTIIARTKRSLGSDNYVGAIYSGRQLGGNQNHVVGVDAQYRLYPNGQTDFSYLNSYTHPDSTGKYVMGHGFNASSFYETRKYGMMVAYEHYSLDFKMESAFQNRTGIGHGWMWLSRNFYPQWKKLPWIKRVSPEAVVTYTHDLETGLDDSWYSADLMIRTTRQGVIYFEAVREMESYEGQTFYANQFNIYNEFQITKWLGYEVYLSHRNRIYYDGEPPYLGNADIANLELTWQPGSKFKLCFDIYHENFYAATDGKRVYEVNIVNSRTTYQVNKYLFFRVTLNYDSYDHLVISDVLASFTYIPGTVLHFGYGMMHERNRWRSNEWLDDVGVMRDMQRSVFFKASYLWRV